MAVSTSKTDGAFYFPEQPVLVITGPTTSGKSETALLLAASLKGEIISADSMQVYRGMDIGTAKVPPDLRRGIPHHLLDILDPKDRFSVADYQVLAYKEIRLIYQRGNQPIVCGGTGQYISALTQGLTFPCITANDALREQFNLLADQEGLASLYKMLAREDPEAAARIFPNDRKRVIRALEMITASGKTQQEHLDLSRRLAPPFAFRSFCLSHDRPILYDRINQRVLQMMDHGLAMEVRSLLESSVPADSTCLQAIGYKEMVPYLNGLASMQDTISTIQQATRRYAKRQLTWFRHMDHLAWLINHEPPENVKLIMEML
jgi:tRNA dimethylallyltransferase